jgi:hypothetical protein
MLRRSLSRNEVDEAGVARNFGRGWISAFDEREVKMTRRATDYAWEKMMNAMSALIADAPLDQRIYDAFIAFHTLRPEDFHDSVLRNRHAEINSLLGVGGNSELDVQARMAALSFDGRQLVRDEIWALAWAVMKDYYRAYPDA